MLMEQAIFHRFYIIHQFTIQLKPKPLHKNLTASFLGAEQDGRNYF